MARKAPQLNFAVLRIRDFRLMLYVRVLSIMALQVQDVIIGWQVYSMTQSYLMLGLVGLAEAVPALVCALYAGHVVDNGRPHKIYVLATLALVFNELMLFLIAGRVLDVDHHFILFWLFSGIFISGLARSFVSPCLYTLLPKIVARNEIAPASAWLGSGFQVAAVGGPAIAGIIYAAFGERGAWALPVTLMFCSLVMLLAVSKTPREYRSTNKREPARQSITAGWRYITERPVLLSVMALDMFAVLFGSAVVMLPAYVDQVLHVGSEELGLLRASPAIGAIICAVVLAVMPMTHIRGTVLLWAVAGFGACIIGFGLSTNLLLSMLLLAGSGAFDSVSMVIRSTLMQLLTTDEMRGRVSSLNSMFIISSNEIGSFRGGVSAWLMGLVPSVVFGGFVTLAVVAVTAKLCPQLRRMRVEAS